ncbi:MAG: hypothetical protein HY000_21680 [Planctomycetes bacterium]|nr:hypothetical protein [Planctomycetota bacterium]
MMGPELRHDTPDREEEPCGDLGLAAFRYIAAEMSASEAAAFEQRLAEDHLAREAVAEMVHLSELASAALAPAPTATVACGSRSHWMAPLAWMTAGAAACLALIATLYGIASAPDVRPVAKVAAPPAVTPTAVDHVALVRKSAELRDAESRDDAILTADEALLTVAAEIQNFDAELNVPDWLLAAVGPSSDCTEIQEN